MEIRKGTVADLDVLAALYDALNDHLAAHENYPGWRKGVYPTREDAEAGVSDGALYVATEGQRIVGTCILRHSMPEAAGGDIHWGVDLPDEKIVYVHTFAVHPDRLRAGVASYMMHFILDEAARRGAGAVRLDVYEKNLPAIRLYEKFGFLYRGKVDLGYAAYGLFFYDLYELIL